VVDGRKQNIFGRVTVPISLFDGTINEVPLAIQVRQSGHHVSLSIGAARLSLSILPKRFAAMLDYMPAASTGSGADEICAPMPGQLTKLLVVEGDNVLPGQDVAIIEAMKMENVLKSEAKGAVGTVHVAEGDNLNVDDLIISLDLADQS
jgi:propionyl-CoA carboxylase alpha chain